jgi:hypothetical protein
MAGARCSPGGGRTVVLGHSLGGVGVPAVTLPGLGHNAHVESPDLPVTLLDPYR